MTEATAMEAAMKASDGDEGRRPRAMARTARAIATAKRGRWRERG